MDILGVQILCLFGLFLSMLGFTLLPFKMIHRSTNDAEAPPTLTGSYHLSSRYQTLVGLANCLSGGVFLATFFVGLLPEVRQDMTDILVKEGLRSSLPISEVVVLLGFFLAMFVKQLAGAIKAGDDQFVEHRLEDISQPSDEAENVTHQRPSAEFSSNHSATSFDHHHHHHHHHHHGHSHDVETLLTPSSSGLRFGILLMSLSVHSLFEGMALGLQDKVQTFLNLYLGVWIHECLIAFALGCSMIKVRMTVCRIWQVAIMFSGLIPIGQVLGLAIGSGRSWSSYVVSTVLQAIAAGTFVEITFQDIIPDALESFGNSVCHRLLKVLFLFIGFAAITAVTIFVLVH